MTPIRPRLFTRLAALILASLFLVAWPDTAHASLIPVDTTTLGVSDDDLCSLTEAIIAANSNSVGAEDDCEAGDDNPLDTIVLAASFTYITSGNYDNFSGFTAYPAITSTIVISGNNSTIARTSSESGSDLARFFYVAQTTGDLTLHDLTLTNGKIADSGAALLVKGTLTLVDSFLISNTASSFGGAIFNEEGSVTVVSSSFEHNHANYGGALGGAISGTTSLTDTDLYSNTADTSGGAIYNQDASIVTLINSRIEENQAGGGGGVTNFGGTLTVIDSTIIANRADIGAGIYNANMGTVTVTNTQILTNVATLYGGGIFSNNQTFLSLNANRIAGNTATTGAGIYNGVASTTTVVSTYIVSNTASGGGGGIYNSDASKAEITNSFILSNTTLHNGGGLFNGSSATAVITGTEIAGNRANDNGGGVYLADGGVDIRNSRLLYNQADDGGGAVAYSTNTLNIDQSCIVGNSYLALHPVFPLTADASDNWWGAPDGPSGDGTGAGDGVGAGVDFDPFLTTPILGCPTLTAQVELEKFATPAGDVLPLQPLTYTVRVTNTGVENVYNLVVVDPVPADYQEQSYFTTGPTINPNGSNFTIPVLAPAEVATIVYTGYPRGTIVNDLSLTNTATVSHALAGLLQASVANNVIVPKFSWSAPTYTATEGDAGSTLQVELRLTPSTPYIDTIVRTVITTSIGISTVNRFFSPNESSLLIDLDAARDGVVGPRVIELGLENFGNSAPGIPATATVTLTDTDSLGLEISQQVSSLEAFLNHTITYTYQVTNTGTVNLSLEAYDDFDGPVFDFFQPLSPQQVLSVTREIYLDEEEYATGELVNTFVVTGTDSSLNKLGRSETVTVSVGITGFAGVTLEVIPSSGAVRVGKVITYTYRIINTGSLDLSDLVLEDAAINAGFGLGTLNAGQSRMPSHSHIVQSDEYPGPLVNQAILTATSELGEIVTVTATASVEVLGDPELALTILPSVNQASVGDVITYTYLITNIGTLPLDDIRLEERAFDENFAIGTLLPDESGTGTLSHTVASGDYPGPLVNDARARGDEPLGGTVSTTATASVELTGETGLALTILPSASEIRLGEVITYTYLMTNTGTLQLDDLVLDEQAYDETFAVGTLLPGESDSRALDHVVQSGDLPGPLVNSAVLTGTNALDAIVTITATATVPIVPYDTSLPFIERE